MDPCEPRAAVLRKHHISRERSYRTRAHADIYFTFWISAFRLAWSYCGARGRYGAGWNRLDLFRLHAWTADKSHHHLEHTRLHACAANESHPVSYTHLRAHETRHYLVCRLLLEKT